MGEKDLVKKEMDRRTFLKVTGAVGLGLTASSFGVPTLLKAEPKTIKIGSVQPATGPLAVIGQGQRRGNQLAVDYINSMGGIKSMGGAKLELLLGDSETKAEVGRSEADRLIKDGAVVLIGAFQSGTGMAIATLAEQRQIPFVMDVAALDAITQKGYKYSFRIFPTVTTFGKTACQYIQQMITERKVTPEKSGRYQHRRPVRERPGGKFYQMVQGIGDAGGNRGAYHLSLGHPRPFRGSGENQVRQTGSALPRLQAGRLHNPDETAAQREGPAHGDYQSGKSGMV